MDPLTPNESRRTSSVYSGVSATARLTLNGNGNGNGNGRSYGDSRPTSYASTAPYVPSYMSHIPTRSQASSLSISVPKTSSQPAAVELPTHELSAAAAHGQLLVLAAGVPHESTLSYIEMLVSRQSFSGIILVASHEQEAALKALKMDCFALIGRLSKAMSVTTHFQDQWSQASIQNTVQQITKTGETIQGVLCCSGHDQSDTASVDVLGMDAEQLQQAWTRSVAFVHASSEATTDLLLSSRQTSSGKLSRVPQGPFFLVAGSPAHSAASQIAKAACDTLIDKLERATKNQGLTVAYAEDVLIPDPVQVEDPSQATSGPFLQPAEMYSTDDQRDSEYAPAESPTKLWALWSDAANIE